MPDRKIVHALLGLITAAFMVTGALYAIYTPLWQTPDEPAHYNYIAQVAGEGCCPVIQPGDWDSAYLDRLKAEGFPEAADLDPIEYEDHQPPLYYLAGSLVYKASGGSLLALRMMSVLFGAGVVLAAYIAGLRLAPRKPQIAVAAALFVGFVPQHVAMMASVNNDSLAELILGMLLVVAIGYVGNPMSLNREGEEEALTPSSRPHATALGGLAGMAFLTKLTIYLPAVLVVAAAIVIRWRNERRSIGWFGKQAAWAGGFALVLGSIWWGRNAIVYGWPDIFAQGAHEVVVVGQLRTAEAIANRGVVTYLRDFVTVTYHSFWGQFGWMGVPMPQRIYTLIGLFLGAVAVGGGLLVRSKRWRTIPAARRAGLWVLGAASVATLANYLIYNATFLQLQGRYLFTAVIPIGMAVTAGLWGWVRMLEGWLPRRVLAWLPIAALGWLPLLAVYALFRYIVPNLN